MNADGARAFVFFDVPVAIREFLQVAVEVQADEFAVAVDDGRAGVAADRVRRVDEIERRREIDLVAAVLETPAADRVRVGLSPKLRARS